MPLIGMIGVEGERVKIINPSGKVVATQKQSVSVPANSTSSSAQQVSVSKPAIWSLESPHLFCGQD